MAKTAKRRIMILVLSLLGPLPVVSASERARRWRRVIETKGTKESRSAGWSSGVRDLQAIGAHEYRPKGEEEEEELT
jgi:hypothetical protein